MAQGWLPSAPDQRTFALLESRILSDLNRPDLQEFATQYAQDAIRLYQRKPFFFNNTDNTTAAQWNAGFYYTQGATLLALADDMTMVAVANLTPGIAGGTVPVFPATVYAPPTNLTSPPVFVPAAGTVQDGGCLWATLGPWQTGIYTQFTTVPSQNQYVPPLDYVAPYRVEITWSSNIREGMEWIPYEEMRSYDVIRPTPPTTYPTMWTFFQQQIYVWPYPVGFYPITLSYRSAPPLPVNADDSNAWTTNAEALIRYWACARISEAVLQDMEAAEKFYRLAAQELQALTSQRIQQESTDDGMGIPPAPW